MLYTSPLLSQASGKLAGLVWSHNAGGAYVRRLATPTNPGSEFQQVVRNALASLAARWREDLADEDRLRWAIYALNTPLTNRLGAERSIGALAMFLRCNVPRIQAGLSVIDAGPTLFGEAVIGAGPDTADASDGTVEIHFPNEAWGVTTGGACLVYVSAPQSPTVNFFKGPYRFAGAILGNTATPPTSPQDVPLPYPVVAGQVIHLQIRATNADGRLSPALRFRTAVVA